MAVTITNRFGQTYRSSFFGLVNRRVYTDPFLPQGGPRQMIEEDIGLGPPEHRPFLCFALERMAVNENGFIYGWVVKRGLAQMTLDDLLVSEEKA